MPTRRTFLSQGLLALAATRCSSSESVSSKPVQNDKSDPSRAEQVSTVSRQRVKLAAQLPRVLCQAGWIVARERGFFAAEGLDVEFLPPVATTPSHHPFGSFLTGPMGVMRGDMVVLEYQNLADLVSGNGDYYVVAGEHSGCRQLVVPVASSIRSIADLAGKRVGINPAYNDSILWEYLARQAGVNPSAIQWVLNSALPGSEEEIAYIKREFAAGRLDGYAQADPFGEILAVDGIARRIASNTWTPPLNGWYCCMIGVRRALVDANPDVVKAITRSLRRGADLVESDPADAVATAVKGGYLSKDTRQDVAARLLGEYVWTVTGRIEEDLERYFSLLIEFGRLPKSAVPRELVKQVYRSGV
jgi:ABC-type nitrate/sulfonate/bicarbonate transport system substrate-binding protein